MRGAVLVFERVIDLPREIVWDALLDPELVSGWLAEAQIDPRVGGQYDLEWMHPDPFPATSGSITELDPPARLVVATSNAGILAFDLGDLPGGTRGRSTALRLTVTTPIEPAFSRSVRAYWLTDLDQLEDLLRGHPVDWKNWDRDRRESWSQHLDEVGDSTA
ncbi:MAG: SRPBCC domain-containing protein [Rhodoglobus sp.]